MAARTGGAPLAVLLLAAILLLPVPDAAAQGAETAGAAAQGSNADGAAAGSQAVISADEISYDETQNTVTASGNVEIAHGERILLAETVRYDQRHDTVVASGDVVMLEPSGEVIFADYVELSDELRNGIIQNIRILLADDSRFAANGARRIDGRKTIMKRAVFSPCKVCEEDPDRPPLWQLKAGTIIHDQESRNVQYTNAWLELFGIPVAYTPYFVHPDPTVERRSGLLVPRFGTSTIFGGYARLPLFLAFNDSVDATIEPIVTAQERSILALEYRQQFNSGLVEISGSGTTGDREVGDPASPTIIKNDTRGHLFAAGRFDISEDWRWGFDYKRASDPTYLDRYDFFGEPGDTLESNLFAERFHGRSYAAANVYSYQDLGLPDPETDPLVAPLLDYNYVGEADSIGGRWNFDTNLRSHIRRDGGPNSRRLSLEGGYMIPFVADFGLVTTLSASVHADGYHFDRVLVDGQEQNNVTTGRVVPSLAVQWRYPLVRGTSGMRQLIEPVAALIAAPNNGNPREIFEEDSVVVELDDTNLFSEDQIPGMDRADLGQRAVYGLKAGLFGERGGRMTAFLGQSYRVPNDSNETLTTDLRGGRSDYVGRLEVVPDKYLDLLYRYRLAEEDFTLLRSELGITMGPPAFQLAGDYIYIASEASGGAFADREEVNAKFTSQLTDFWSVGVNARRDLTPTGGPLEQGAQMTYEDECFKLELTYRRNFTKTIDVEPETSILVQLVFKTLGNITAEQVQKD